MKVPQILKIVRSKSAEGLSLSMFTLELVGYRKQLTSSYTINAAYGYANEFPVTAYGENIFVMIQSRVSV